MTNLPPASPTSEPIPASDQLREALNKLEASARMTQLDYDADAELRICQSAARAAVEELFSAQLGEIEDLRTRLRGGAEQIFLLSAELASLRVENQECREILLEGEPDLAEDSLSSLLTLAVGSFRARLKSAWAERDRNAAELASLRSSSLTAEEAAAVISIAHEDEAPYESQREAYNGGIAKLRTLRALRSSTADKGKE